MSLLKKLKLVTALSHNPGDKIHHQRRKLAIKIDHQIQLATAEMAGRAYTISYMKHAVNPESGLNERVSAARRVRAWYWLTSKGTYQLCIKYGNKKLLLLDDKDAVESADLAGVIDALHTIRQAAIAGELDSQLAAAGHELRSGFKKEGK